MRIFLSAELGDAVKDRLEKAVMDFERTGLPVKWVRRDNLHLTLKFIGEADAPVAEDIMGSLGRCTEGLKPFRITFGGLGTFPVNKPPRVIWIGIGNGAKELSELAEKIEKGLPRSAAGITGDKPFSPHLTVGRVKGSIEGNKLEELKTLASGIDLGSGMVESVALVKSVLKPEGPEYGIIGKVLLK